jgi:adenosyl cobinamide kinase/adenosyl cobinamide phosphate guanylyltransferase
MKVFLMHPDQDFDTEGELPANEPVLSQDLELNTLVSAMAAGDAFLFEIARRALLSSLRDCEAIAYRQAILKDALETPSVIRDLYALAGEALAAEKSVWGSLLRESPRTLLGTSVRKMEVLVAALRRLREIADQHAEKFRSPGLCRFFAMLSEELDDEYFELIEGYLKELNFKGGPLLSARLSTGNKGTGYTLRRPREQGFIDRLLDRSGYSFTLPDRDEAGARALGQLEDRGVNLVGNALTQSRDHVLSFFLMLRVEIGFYVACLNLNDRLESKNEPLTFPIIAPRDQVALSAHGLYDVCLALTLDQPVVPNDIEAENKSLVMITGANQGGKSTFLRSLGLAQLMSQCGMFVAGTAFRANACDGVFTHYKREEDETMESGKLDEELARMSDIADHITPGCLLLCNESFAATNEREGSQIARHVLDALLAEHVKVVFVTHMFDLAQGFYEQNRETALFLRAERGSDGARPFRLSEAKPLPTSYGEDSYRKIFGRRVGTATAAGSDS